YLEPPERLVLPLWLPPDRVRVRFTVVWLATMAVRGVLAVPDTGRAPAQMGLPGHQRGRQAQHPRAELRAAVPRLVHDPQEVRQDPGRLREPDSRRLEDAARIS